MEMEKEIMEQLLQKFTESMETKISEIKKEFSNQTTILVEKLTTNMANTIEEKLKPILEENLTLKKEVTTLNKKVLHLEREIKKNNIILHGIGEKENEDKNDLMNLVIGTLNDARIEENINEFDKWEISEVRRLGKKISGKQRPILIRLTLAWRKIEILKKCKNFPTNVYATEDFSKEVLQTRKELKKKVKEEIEKGNRAFIRYDKIIIKGKENEKRKRSPSQPPADSYERIGLNQKASKINKTNAFEYLQRPRTNSQTTSKQ